MSNPLRRKLVIITDASRGLGAALARHLASKGTNIVINYTSSRSSSLAQDLATELQTQHKVETLVAQVDITTPDGSEELVTLAKSHFTSSSGTFSIDILLNNAGIVNPALMSSITLLDFETIFDLNTRAPLFVLQAALPYLPHDRSGRVINLSSITTSMGFWWQSCYAGTKGALEALTRELGERCTVNSINPGAMATDMYSGLPQEMLEKVWNLNYMAPLARAWEGVDAQETIEAAKRLGGRPAYLAEVTGIVRLLCMPEAGWITGQVVGINGGGVMTKGR